MKQTRIHILIALLGAVAVGLPSLRGATITVVNTNDNGAGSLRQALAGDTRDVTPLGARLNERGAQIAPLMFGQDAKAQRA